jgi:hypothetical protein
MVENSERSIEDSPQQATGNLESRAPRQRRGIFESPRAYPRSKMRGMRIAVLFNLYISEAVLMEIRAGGEDASGRR